MKIFTANSRQFRVQHPALKLAAQTIAMLLACHPAWAQEEAKQALERVEITGSAIRRIATETALPVQVITRADIDKTGVTTAAELMAKVSANVGGLTDGASINVGGDQRGFNSANLRGIGTSSTLVLLNGRRMANFASPGDDAGVDLNNIPAAALQRVEILLDGASALYGTDAIGGVINFITRKDFQGVELNAYGGLTKEGGAGKRSVSLSAGTGDISKDGYNIFAVIDAQHTGALNTSQRSFIGDLKIPERLGHLLSSFTSPANIRLTSNQRDLLREQGFMINGKTIVSRQINLSVPNCNPPANLYLPSGTGGEDACTYNYMGDTELYPRSDKANFLSRGVLQINPDQQIYAELALSQARTYYVGSGARVTGYLDASRVPQLAGAGLGSLTDDDVPGELTVRTRLSEAGRRTSELTSSGQRLLVGLTGSAAGWDYDLGLNHSVNTVQDKNTNGYLLYDQLMAGIADGRINPFGPSGAAGVSLINSIQVNDVVRRARGTMDTLDFRGSRALFKMAGGSAMLALGGELRREHATFTPSALLMSDNINNDPAPEGGKATSDTRNVAAVYGEILAPFSKGWEAQLSVRQDHYQGVGNAVSPKVGLSYLPSKELLVRTSAGTGFRAPSMNDLYRPAVYSFTATLPDPVYCATVENDLSVCADNWATRRYSNDKLKPERSQQFSAGVVIEPNKHLNLSVDYWNIKRSDLISEIGDDVILGNLSKYNRLVHRDTDGLIEFIDLQKENRGAQKVSGIDLVANLHSLKSQFGTFGVRMNGTLVLSSKLQTAPEDAFISNLGKFVTKGVVQRWRHRITLDWNQGPASISLSNNFSSSYDDQNSAINIDDGSIVAANRVSAYSTWDLAASYMVNKQFTLRAGLQNMLNASPPYSNQAYFFLSGYDPSYTDPRGRFAYLSAQFKF